MRFMIGNNQLVEKGALVWYVHDDYPDVLIRPGQVVGPQGDLALIRYTADGVPAQVYPERLFITEDEALDFKRTLLVNKVGYARVGVESAELILVSFDEWLKVRRA